MRVSVCEREKRQHSCEDAHGTGRCQYVRQVDSVTTFYLAQWSKLRTLTLNKLFHSLTHKHLYDSCSSKNWHVSLRACECNVPTSPINECTLILGKRAMNKCK